MFMTDDQQQLEELGIDQDFTHQNTDIRMIDFYVINYLYPSSNNKYTIIGSNGTTFCCPKTVSYIKELINQKESECK